jgi:hypothetical protein
MPRFPTQSTLALLGALLCLAACAPTATVRVPPTPTTPPAPTATPTLAPAPTPTNVPAGWAVLDTAHFSLAYPPDWTPQTYPQQDGSVLYVITAPDKQAGVRVSVQEHVPTSTIGGPYCVPANGDIQHTTLAGLPMAYMLSGEGLFMRTWTFANAQSTVFTLDAEDAQSSSATKAQDEAILATFRPDNVTPWSC